MNMMQVTDYTRQSKSTFGLERALGTDGHRRTHVLTSPGTLERCPIRIDSGAVVVLFINSENLYVHGYGGGQKVFVTDDNPSPAITGDRLGYRSNYGALGWDRSTTPARRFRVQDIRDALLAASRGEKLKREEFINLAILMEITRFPSLARKVTAGEAISNTEVDWGSQHRAKNTEIITSKMANSA